MAATGGIYAVKPLKYVGKVLFGDAGPRILHAEDHLLVYLFRPKGYPSPGWGMAEGVGKQVGEHLKGPFLIGPYPGGPLADTSKATPLA